MCGSVDCSSYYRRLVQKPFPAIMQTETVDLNWCSSCSKCNAKQGDSYETEKLFLGLCYANSVVFFARRNINA